MELSRQDTEVLRKLAGQYAELAALPEMMHALMERMTHGLQHQIEAANRLGIYRSALRGSARSPWKRHRGKEQAYKAARNVF